MLLEEAKSANVELLLSGGTGTTLSEAECSQILDGLVEASNQLSARKSSALLEFLHDPEYGKAISCQRVS